MKENSNFRCGKDGGKNQNRNAFVKDKDWQPTVSALLWAGINSSEFFAHTKSTLLKTNHHGTFLADLEGVDWIFWPELGGGGGGPFWIKVILN